MNKTKFAALTGIGIGIFPLIFLNIAPRLGVKKPFAFPMDSLTTIQCIVFIGAVSLGVYVTSLGTRRASISQASKILLGALMGMIFFFSILWLIVLSGFTQLN